MPYRHLSLLVAVLGFAALILSFPPQPQPQWYHEFADQRSLLGIPHFFNVISNLAFLVVGGWGLWQLRLVQGRFAYRYEYRLWQCFFIAVVLICLGSGYYHLAPSDDTLLWDRLAIALAFGLLLSIALEEHLPTRMALSAGAILILYALFSVLYWWWSEQQGNGDLRLYLLLQTLTLSLLPLIYLLYHGRYDHHRYIPLSVAVYFLAVLSEWLDEEIYQLGGLVSGHTLKHLLVALSVVVLIIMLKRRALRR